MEGRVVDRSSPGQGEVAGCCECGNEPSGSIKRGEFLEQLRKCQLLRKDSAPWSCLSDCSYGVCRNTGIHCMAFESITFRPNSKRSTVLVLHHFLFIQDAPGILTCFFLSASHYRHIKHKHESIYLPLHSTIFLTVSGIVLMSNILYFINIYMFLFSPCQLPVLIFL